jgi:hypothetical protein
VRKTTVTGNSYAGGITGTAQQNTAFDNCFNLGDENNPQAISVGALTNVGGKKKMFIFNK